MNVLLTFTCSIFSSYLALKLVLVSDQGITIEDLSTYL